MRRLYGSIPHLPGSRAASDKTKTAAQAQRSLDPAAARDGEEVIVQEKLDGSCVAILRDATGKLEARGREGNLAAESRNDARRMFSTWLADNAARLSKVIGEEEVLVGEWLALVHGTRYRLHHEPFVAFDLLKAGRVRVTVDELSERLAPAGVRMPAVVHRGAPCGTSAACVLLGEHGRHGAIDPPEGLVYRVEHGGGTGAAASRSSPSG